MLKALKARLIRLVMVEQQYEYRYKIRNHSDTIVLEPVDPVFELLQRPTEVAAYQWENGEREAREVEGLLARGEVVGILHRDGIVYSRLALRTRGSVSTEAQRNYRPLEEGEGYFHFMRTAMFARGNGYQVKIHAPYYDTDIVRKLSFLTSTCNVNNIASIKGIERSGGYKIKRIISVGFLGGRFGFAISRPLETTSQDNMKL